MATDRHKNEDTLTFLGTGGGRMVVLSQLRQSGGMWLKLDSTNILVDPGPGCLVHCHRLGLKPRSLDAIVLSHRHLDHSSDINVMIEAMTYGGFKHRGLVLVPPDCLGDDPVILGYLRGFTEITSISRGLEVKIKNVKVTFPLRNRHPVETYGSIYTFSSGKIGYIPDTLPFPGLAEAYKGLDYLVINVVRKRGDGRIAHLTIDSARDIIEEARPRTAILTHFGLQILKAGPEELCRMVTDKTGVRTLAAEDNLTLPLKTGKTLDDYL